MNGQGMEEEWKRNLANGLKEKSRNKKRTKSKEKGMKWDIKELEKGM